MTVTAYPDCISSTSIEIPASCSLYTTRSFTEGDAPNTYDFSVSAFGDAPPFSYQWSTGQTDSAILITEAGHYEVSISDANNCLLGTDVTLNSGPDGLCELTARMRERDDRLSVSLSRGAVGTTYFWSDGSTEQDILNPLPDTPYSVTITHPDGCSTIVQRRL
ncbi:MAG: hypothetical protein AAFZ63_03060 [Bacteroidota bacterium]